MAGHAAAYGAEPFETPRLQRRQIGWRQLLSDNDRILGQGQITLGQPENLAQHPLTDIAHIGGAFPQKLIVEPGKSLRRGGETVPPCMGGAVACGNLRKCIPTQARIF
jgi:hypothetical protein